MSSLSRFNPDDIYCVYCHAPAAGPCATCQALICADCGSLTGGSVKKVVVCQRCADGGRGEVTGKTWWRVATPWILFFGALLVVAALVRFWMG